MGFFQSYQTIPRPMTIAAKNPATWADLESVPPHLVAEINFVGMGVCPQPSPRHSMPTVFQRLDQNWRLSRTRIDDEPMSALLFDAIPFHRGLLWPFNPLITEPAS